MIIDNVCSVCNEDVTPGHGCCPEPEVYVRSEEEDIAYYGVCERCQCINPECVCTDGWWLGESLNQYYQDNDPDGI